MSNFDIGQDIGQKAPDFTLPVSRDQKIALKDYLGKNVVLAFYPLDFTGG
jgi:thioredoxin-dependent peroxiredoxin